MRQCVLGLLATVAVAVTVVAQSPTRTKVMLLDGESGGPYHKWQLTTPLIKKALAIPCGTEFRESTPGVYVRRGDFADILRSRPWAVLDESGADIRHEVALPDGFILSDHLNFTEAEEALVGDLPRYSVGPLSLHADHTITVVQNEWDRRRCGWR